MRVFDDLHNLLHHFIRRVFDRWRHCHAEIEIVTADAEQHHLRFLPIQRATQRQHVRRCHVVRSRDCGTGLRIGMHQRPGDSVWTIHHGGIHEYHHIEPTDRLGDVHFELVCNMEFNIRQIERSQPLDDKPTGSVVATALVAISDNQNFHLRLVAVI